MEILTLEALTIFLFIYLAMAVSDDMMEGIVTLDINSTEFGWVGAMLSPEDVAWADSCLTKDADILDSGWNSMKDALLETLSAQHDTSAHERDEFSEPKMEIFSSIAVKSGISTVVSSKGAQTSRGDQLSRAKTDDFWSRHGIEYAFVPSYNNSLKDLGISDLDLGLVVQAFQLDQSTEDIFRIWDLGIPREEDDFVKQFNGAFAESYLEPMPSVSDHSVASKGLNDESLGDLISGIADLSLRPNFG